MQVRPNARTRDPDADLFLADQDESGTILQHEPWELGSVGSVGSVQSKPDDYMHASLRIHNSYKRVNCTRRLMGLLIQPPFWPNKDQRAGKL